MLAAMVAMPAFALVGRPLHSMVIAGPGLGICRNPPCTMDALKNDQEDRELFMAAQPRVLLKAAADVHAAAARFGRLQERAAIKYTHELLKYDATPPSGLFDRQADLFNSCLVLSDCTVVDECMVLDEPAPSMCDDLRKSMGRLQGLVAQRRASERADHGSFDVGTLLSLFRSGGSDAEIQRAVGEVEERAARFGPQQRSAASEWAHQLAQGHAPLESGALLEQRVALFDSCQLGDGVGESACVELHEAVTTLHDLRALLMARAAADGNVASEAKAKAAEQSRQSAEYRNKIPEPLIAWGCDDALWEKIKNRTALRKLARIGDEEHGRQRIASLRAKLLGP